jgi:hypothetical protein
MTDDNGASLRRHISHELLDTLAYVEVAPIEALARIEHLALRTLGAAHIAVRGDGA